jgi:NAD-dependent dihydropyrimidine dehydrogenase PreA subunit
VVFVITDACIDCKDASCVEACPVDCIYEGRRSFYIHPEECIGCGACESVCPVEAIWRADVIPESLKMFVDDNARFFQAVALREPGGAAGVGPIDYDTELVANAAAGAGCQTSSGD